MRALSSTLLAAQQDPSSLPFVRVTVSDEVAGIVRLRWERLYTGGETDAYHAAAIPADGSLLRLRVDPAGPTLHYQRTVSPGGESDFSGWTDLGSVADTGVALSANGGNVLRAYVASNGSDIQVEDSSDHGANFGSAVTAASLADVTWLAAALKSNSDAALVYADASTVYTVRRASGSWGTPAAWPYIANSIDGVAIALFGDFHVAIAGTDGDDNPRLWTAVYGDGVTRPPDTWSALHTVAEADAGSGVSFRAPFLAYPDTARLFFVETYSGTVAYARPQWTWFPSGQSFEANAWREPIPFDLESDFGIAIAGDGARAWLSTPSGVWRAPLDTQETDLSDDLLELSIEARPLRGSATAVLRNDDGRYNDLPAGPYSVIRRGAQITVAPGFVTTQGEEVSTPALTYWIDRWEHTTAGGAATLVLHAADAWSLVERWRARRQHTWQDSDATVSELLTRVAALAGVELAGAGISNVATNHKPAFTVHPGESGLRAIERLLAMVPDRLRLSGAVAQLFETGSSDSAVYTYGGTHPIFHARYGSTAPARNRVQVFGDGLFAEAFDWSAIEDRYDHLRQVFDLNLTTQADVEDRAAIALRQEALAAHRGELVTPVNCGQELYDVVSVTDAAAGLSGEEFRVLGIDVRYIRRSQARRSPVYEQRLHLGNV